MFVLSFVCSCVFFNMIAYLSKGFLRETRRDGSEQRQDANCLDRERKDQRQIVAACLHLLLDDDNGVM
jgi:hypothetical protein